MGSEQTILNLLHVKKVPILEQLRLEEALIRTNSANWCLINEGSPPAIVLGISGKIEELVDQNTWEKRPIPLIRRFSGGGTVIVDEQTLFISFLFQTEEHESPPYPEPILRWSEELYKECLPSSFHLRENDYAIGEKKCGGNAQYHPEKQLGAPYDFPLGLRSCKNGVSAPPEENPLLSGRAQPH